MRHPRVTSPLLLCLQPFIKEVNRFGPDHPSNQHLNPCFQIIPNILNWTTYPITSLIKKMWIERRDKLTPGGEIAPHDVEFMSMLERTLNYAHTGSGRVLTRTLMDRVFLSLGIVNDGFPVINSAFLDFNKLAIDRTVVVYTDHWPLDKTTKAPVICSKRCQQLTYNESHAQVRYNIIIRYFRPQPPCCRVSFAQIPHTSGLRIAWYSLGYIPQWIVVCVHRRAN